MPFSLGYLSKHAVVPECGFLAKWFIAFELRNR